MYFHKQCILCTVCIHAHTSHLANHSSILFAVMVKKNKHRWDSIKMTQEIRAWLRNYNHDFPCDVITYPCLNFNGGENTVWFSVRMVEYGRHDDVIKWKYFPCWWPVVRGKILYLDYPITQSFPTANWGPCLIPRWYSKTKAPGQDCEPLATIPWLEPQRHTAS